MCGLSSNPRARYYFQLLTIIQGFTWIVIMILWIYGTVKMDNTLCNIQTQQSLNIWLFVKKLSPTFIPNFEEENQCCGWFGVFDHCTSQNREAIIIESVETQALNEIKDTLDIDSSFDDSNYDIFNGMDLNKTDSSYSEDLSYSYSEDSEDSESEAEKYYFDVDYSDSNYEYDSPNNRGSSLSICDPDFDKSEFLFYWNRNCTKDKTVSEVCPLNICHINNCARRGIERY